jgi:hypothetical protein
MKIFRWIFLSRVDLKIYIIAIDALVLLVKKSSIIFIKKISIGNILAGFTGKEEIWRYEA